MANQLQITYKKHDAKYLVKIRFNSNDISRGMFLWDKEEVEFVQIKDNLANIVKVNSDKQYCIEVGFNEYELLEVDNFVETMEKLVKDAIYKHEQIKEIKNGFDKRPVKTIEV